jgi:hypothetical protein
MSQHVSRRDLIVSGAMSAVALSLNSTLSAAQAPQNNTPDIGVVMAGIEPIPLDDAARTALFPQGSVVLDRLPNQTAMVSTYVLEQDGSVSYLVANAAVKGQKIIVKQDYMMFTSYKKPTENIDYRVGIAVRTVANVRVLKGNINTAGLLPLGLAASRNEIQGSLEVTVLGISGANITNAIPTPAQLTPETVQRAIEGVAIIKSRIYDSQSATAATAGNSAPVQDHFCASAALAC